MRASEGGLWFIFIGSEDASRWERGNFSQLINATKCFKGSFSLSLLLWLLTRNGAFIFNIGIGVCWFTFSKTHSNEKKEMKKKKRRRKGDEEEEEEGWWW
jgi:hypothetical protein